MRKQLINMNECSAGVRIYIRRKFKQKSTTKYALYLECGIITFTLDARIGLGKSNQYARYKSVLDTVQGPRRLPIR